MATPLVPQSTGELTWPKTARVDGPRTQARTGLAARFYRSSRYRARAPILRFEDAPGIWSAILRFGSHRLLQLWSPPTDDARHLDENVFGAPSLFGTAGNRTAVIANGKKSS